MQDCLTARLFDVKGNSDDPFISVFGSHGHQKEIHDLGYKNDSYGFLGGLDFVKTLKSGAFVRYGLLASFSHSSAKFFGSETENGKFARQNAIFGGVFGSYEGFNAKGLKNNFNLTVGIGHARNKVWRTDLADNRYDGKFNSINFYAHCEFVKNLMRIGNVQIGPWAAASYNHITQRKYSELGNSTNAATVNRMDFDSLEAILGLNLEREFHNSHDNEKRIKVFARAGWEYGAVDSHSPCEITIGGENSISNAFSSKSKHYLFLSCGLRARLSKHLEISGIILGRVNRNRSFLSASVCVGYSF
jgi:uncharacterized protein with beta-barrel porin domain